MGRSCCKFLDSSTFCRRCRELPEKESWGLMCPIVAQLAGCGTAGHVTMEPQLMMSRIGAGNGVLGCRGLHVPISMVRGGRSAAAAACSWTTCNELLGENVRRDSVLRPHLMACSKETGVIGTGLLITFRSCRIGSAGSMLSRNNACKLL